MTAIDAEPGMAVVDLGCAGGWMQVVSMRTKLGNGPARLVGIDLLETEGLLGRIFLPEISLTRRC